ncbi:MAG: preprotein translocase subunit SecE [Candidatus Scalindua sp. AMX11]|nr:MAG: preprotein translocase subunit SecE [Candidatus Scalindua sp.]NOG85474.1 preprotein translocase subunit SecE [Planctomycetota bacterium]RZV90303.1 MAG: preprotein translocase subunit SecE [Candidatus Scalindua sp. SCAELEC01]TDE64711.1 MAG: preprotein translocase subunit SecE [Candidatus Scalindua sp. AMX11]
MGVYSRSAVAGLFGLASLFASYSLYGVLVNLPALFVGAKIPLLGVDLTWGLVCSFVLFLVCGCLIFLFTTGFEVGLGWLDGKSKRAVEFFIDTQGELQKVSWPTKNELVGSTVVVIVFLLLMSLYIFGVDWVVSTAMESIGLL